MRLLKSLNERLARVEGLLLSILLLAMVLLAFVQVVARNVFNAGIPWADTVVRHSVLWVGFLGAALATKLEQHLSIDVLTKFVPERVRHLLGLVLKSFAIVVCLWLFKASLTFLEIEKAGGEQFLELFPLWWTELIIPATFLLVPFHLSVAWIGDIAYLARRGRQ